MLIVDCFKTLSSLYVIEVSTCLPLTSPSYVLVCSLPQADNAMIQINVTTIKNDVIQKFKFVIFFEDMSFLSGFLTKF